MPSRIGFPSPESLPKRGILSSILLSKDILGYTSGSNAIIPHPAGWFMPRTGGRGMECLPPLPGCRPGLLKSRINPKKNRDRTCVRPEG